MKSISIKGRYMLFAVLTIAFLTSEGPTRKKPLSKNEVIEGLIAQMTVEEKVGQLNFLVAGVVTGPTATPATAEKYSQLIRENKVGGFFNTYGVETTLLLQKIAVEKTRLKIPLIFGADVIHGFRTIFPIPLAQAASWDLAEIEKAEKIAADEATAVGITLTFAPMVDIARDPRWGRIAEGSGEDPYLGSLIAAARIRGFQGADYSSGHTLLSCTKHFAAYGAAEAGRDYNTVDMSERLLREVYLPPFKAAVDAGTASFMPSFNELDGVPATGSDFLLNQILRKEWGYKGAVISDYGAIGEMISHGAFANQADAAERAIKVGVDMDMEAYAYINQLPTLVKEGKVSMETLNESVRKVLGMKFDLGLFDNPYKYCDAKREKTSLLTPEHLAAARTMSAKSIVLLKNDNNVLPLSKDIKTIAVIGPLADAKKEMNGTWAFFGNNNDPVTILEGIRQKVSKNSKVLYAKGCGFSDTSTAAFLEAITIAKQSDIIVVSVGENADMSGEAACRTSISLPGVQEQLIKELKKLGKPVVVLLTSGRPLDLSWLDKHVPAILETWFLGTQTGNAVADVLFGDYNPSGKLPVTFPRNVGQIPIYYSHKNTGRPYNEFKDPNNTVKYASRYLDVSNSPLYPFGYGLSYTTFDYSEIKLDKNALTANETITVSIEVKNSGKVAGEETVQLYIHDLVGSVTRPVKELKGFKKIILQPGEVKTITFQLTAKDLSFYRKDMTFGTEPGTFNVYVGTNSNQVKEASFMLQ